MKKLVLLLGFAALPLGTAQAAGDPVAGKKSFGQCLACHSMDPAKPDTVGPNLAGVYGAKAATRRPKFKYSPALRASKLKWDDATLDAWIKNSAAMVPGSKMHFIGIPKKQVRDNLIAYLKAGK